MIVAYVLKTICIVLLIYVVCRLVLTSSSRSNKAKNIFAMMVFIPIGLITVVSMAESLSSSYGHSTATVVLWSGIVAVLFSVCLSTTLGKRVFANIVGSAVYDLLKTAFRVIARVPSVLKRLFK